MQKRFVLVCEDSLCLKKLPDVSGPGLREVGSLCLRKLPVLVCEDSLCPRKLSVVSGPGLGEAGCYRRCDIPAQELNRIDRILISTSYNLFSGSRSPKNSEVKRAWPGAIWGWVTDREVIPRCARVRTKCAENTCVGL